MSPIDGELIQTTDYLYTALDIRALVKGRSGNWRATVAGIDPETGSQVAVAYYDLEYAHKADASQRAKEILVFIKKAKVNK